MKSTALKMRMSHRLSKLIGRATRVRTYVRASVHAYEHLLVYQNRQGCECAQHCPPLDLTFLSFLANHDKWAPSMRHTNTGLGQVVYSKLGSAKSGGQQYPD